MIEPWDLYADVGRTPEFQVKLSSAQPFLLNITKKFVETVLTSLEQWEKDSAQQKSLQESERAPFHPYYIQNATGLTLTYWITNSQHKYRVENNSKVPLNLSDLDVDGASRDRYSFHAGEMKQDVNMPLLSIQLDDYDLVPLHNLIFHKQVSYLFQDISNRNKNLSLHYRVQYEDGSRVITIGSDIVISNCTVVPLQIQLESPMLAPFYMDPILPGTRATIPVRYAADSKIRVRPFEFAYDWSRESIRTTPTMKEKVSAFFTCPSKDHKDSLSPHWLYSVEQRGVRSTNLGLSFDDDQEVEIRILAPFKIENTLPCKVSYLIKSPDGVNLTSGSLPIGNTAEIHQVLSDHRPIVHIRIPDFRWSEGKKIGPTNKHSMTLFNKQGDGCKIHIQAEQTRLGTRSC
eukprot:CAMPEP_0117059756 /NCGR_PEP_ID=MMETSP0472-20121206/41541_1 /TAXON_ID=693140 ORGANISM="Tiarina fusus, Strain LIS" /NCGR_SAMPLE_ID=MMETSP0472 /ASSEMBLY_ACC=CAM_ASM_000603 /LENGTH=402 /DNA_ID=CAMNT_0004777653 /DNA_START=149 /DNA_END=1354 /DNA_ORIENTATION=-